ncbi:hypothetical protein MKW94_018832 [Papaver nudicaule]|uniref:Uncharacterized protein n=1 Tax=Papaver nudicaule TaxID=74823 RepID=A0AA42AUF6_PAPNU|nr:hypothetical protein [Papaver nudicaule]
MATSLSPSELSARYREVHKSLLDSIRKIPEGDTCLKKLEEKNRNQNDENEKRKILKDLGLGVAFGPLCKDFECGEVDPGMDALIAEHMSRRPVFVTPQLYAMRC